MFTFLFMSNHDMTSGARVNLHKQASNLGENTIEIQPADFMYTTSTVFIGHKFTLVTLN